jgi:hypothetical protein
MARVGGKHGPKRYTDKDRSIQRTGVCNCGDGVIDKTLDLAQFSAPRCAVLSRTGYGEYGEPGSSVISKTICRRCTVLPRKEHHTP